MTKTSISPAAAGPQAVGGWQSIKTAPRDGTPVDLWHVNGFRVCESWWDSEDQCWSCCNDDEMFTHWMPLPAPPESAP